MKQVEDSSPLNNWHSIQSVHITKLLRMTRSGKIIINKINKKKAIANEIKKSNNRLTNTDVSTFQITTPTATCSQSTNNLDQLISKQVNCLQRFEFFLALFNRLLIGFVTIYISWMCLRLPITQIPFHALLCTIGFVCLMSEGLLAHYRSNAWTQLCYRTERTRTHWVLQICGSVLGLIGILIKLSLQEVHFSSLHGQLGLAVIIVLLLSLFTGVSSLFAAEWKGFLQPIYNKGIHNILGLGTFGLAMCCMYTAFSTEIFLTHSLEAKNYVDFQCLLKIAVIAIWLLSSYGPAWCFVYSKLWSCY